MNEKFFNVAESVSAKESYTNNNALSPNDLHEKMQKAIGTDEIFGGKVIGKSDSGLLLDFGNGIYGFLEQHNADIRRKYSFVQRTSEGSYINVSIIAVESNDTFVASRKNIIYTTHEYHKKVLKAGDVINVTVVQINEKQVYFDIGGGDCSGILAAFNISHKYSIPSESFYIGQEVSLLVLNYNDEFGTFELRYSDVRQAGVCGIKTNTVINAEITEAFENESRKFKCVFPDFENTEGVIYGIPKGFILNPGNRIPVTVTGLKHAMPIAKF